jgi:acyl carrier protein
MLANGTRVQRVEVLRTLLVTRAAKVLGAAAAEVDVERPLSNLGLDSLMAVELRNWIQSELRVNLNTVELMRGPSITQLVEALVDQIEREASQGVGAAEAPAAPAPLNGEAQAAEQPGVEAEGDRALLSAVLDEMPPDQLEALLGQAGGTEQESR